MIRLSLHYCGLSDLRANVSARDFTGDFQRSQGCIGKITHQVIQELSWVYCWNTVPIQASCRVSSQSCLQHLPLKSSLIRLLFKGGCEPNLESGHGTRPRTITVCTQCEPDSGGQIRSRPTDVGTLALSVLPRHDRTLTSSCLVLWLVWLCCLGANCNIPIHDHLLFWLACENKIHTTDKGLYTYLKPRQLLRTFPH